MKRILVRLLFCVAATAGLVIAPMEPAAADTNVCVGEGFFSTLNGDMTFTTTQTRTFELFVPGLCEPGSFAEFLFGTITGRCGLAVGTGYANGRPDHTFDIFWEGRTLILDGDHVTGSYTVVENPLLLPDNCVTGAHNWFGPGFLALHHL
jgi:hypothetical protein